MYSAHFKPLIWTRSNFPSESLSKIPNETISCAANSDFNFSLFQKMWMKEVHRVTQSRYCWWVFVFLEDLICWHLFCFSACREIYFNPVGLNQIRIVITLFRLIWHRTEFRLAWYQSENAKCNLFLVNFLQEWEIDSQIWPSGIWDKENRRSMTTLYRIE